MGILFIMLGTSWGWADSQISHCAFYQTIQNTLIYKNVQVVRRNEDVGLHREENIYLREWISLSDTAVLGVDKEGRVLSVLQLSDRVVARPLSGRAVFKHIFLSSQGALIAVNANGEVYRFRQALWAKSPVKNVVQMAAKLLGGATCASVGTALTLVWMFPEAMHSPEVVLSAGLGMSGVLSSVLYFSIWQYEHDNDFPDGFVKVAPVFGANPKIGSFDLDPQGWVEDYQINSEIGAISLQAQLKGVDLNDAHHFQVRCEDELLSRGIPERAYTPAVWLKK